MQGTLWVEKWKQRRHVTSHAECGRRNRSLKKTKMIHGIVIDAKVEKRPQNKRVTWFVTADYDFGAGVVKPKS
jgi:hypothetical protein